MPSGIAVTKKYDTVAVAIVHQANHHEAMLQLGRRVNETHDRLVGDFGDTLRVEQLSHALAVQPGEHGSTVFYVSALVHYSYDTSGWSTTNDVLGAQPTGQD